MTDSSLLPDIKEMAWGTSSVRSHFRLNLFFFCLMSLLRKASAEGKRSVSILVVRCEALFPSLVQMCSVLVNI